MSSFWTARLSVIAALLFCGSVMATAQRDVRGTLVHDGITRTYRLHLPPQYTAGTRLPLVLNLHGRGSTGAEQEAYTQMNAIADTAGFAVCYPDGIGDAREWNVGWVFGSRTDDLGFLTRLTDTLQARYGFDESRTYSCGMSNGGFMSYVLACERPKRFAAVASVTGGMAPGRTATCTPEVPVPTLQIHGTNDQVVRFAGTPFVNDPIDTTVAFWRKLNGCGAAPVVTQIPDRADDGYTSTRYVYGECDLGAETRYIVVQGGGHTWPGGAIEIGGGTTYDFSASEKIWQFFRRFSRGAPTGLGAVVGKQPILEVWPNPVRMGQLSLKPVDYERDLVIVDGRGQVFRTVTMGAGDGSFDLGQPQVGVYYLYESGRLDGATARFVVQP